MELDGLLQKMMIVIFIGDLYSMYVVLQGIGSLPCIRVYIIYIIPFGEEQSWMSEVPQLERFNRKNRSTEMINFFLYCIKKNVFQAHRRVPPTTGFVEL